MKSYITKTDIKSYLQCPLKFYREFTNPSNVPKKDPYLQLLAKRGDKVGDIARECYPEGVMVYEEKMPIKDLCEKTKNQTSTKLFEAGYLAKDLHVRVDMFIDREIIEVKSGSKLEDDYIEDAAIQLMVLNQAGIQVDKVSVWYINKKCELPDLTNLFIKEDVTERAKALIPSLENTVEQIRALLKKSESPNEDIGPRCDSPYECPFKKECYANKGVPEISVLDIPRAGKRAWEYYKQGIFELDKIDPTPFTALQRRMIDAHVSGENFLNLKNLVDTLDSWKFPFYFLDFEAMEYDFPGFAKTFPGQMLPFQASIHVWKSLNSPIEKVSEYLHKDNTDPRSSMASFLVKHIPLKGTVIAYNAPFEVGKIKDLFKVSSEEEKAVLESLVTRFQDPLPLIRDSYYHPGFKGSYSIKTVAPALLGNEASYSHLEIQDGTAAVVAYKQYLLMKEGQEKDALETALLAYCDKDTFVLAGILKFLYNLAYGK